MVKTGLDLNAEVLNQLGVDEVKVQVIVLCFVIGEQRA